MKIKLAWAAVGCLLWGAAAGARAQTLEELHEHEDIRFEANVAESVGDFRAQGERLEKIKKWWHDHTLGAPYTGRHRIIFIPAKVGNAIGEQVYAQMIAKYRALGKVDTDPEAVAQLKRVCDRLIAASEVTDLKWEYHLIDTGTVNAFAVAGGKIGVLKGILKYTQDDLGLAVVLGHEVGHVIARHLDERLSEVILLQAGIMIGGAVLPMALPALIPQAILQMGNVAATISQIYQFGTYEGMRLGLAGFSRTQESESDRIGMIIMAKAGYDPLLAADFWKRMLSAYPDPKKHAKLLKYWRSHPLTAYRVANITKWAPEIREKYYKPQP